VDRITLLTVRLLLVAACGGFAAYTDARIHEIPDPAWILGLVGAVIVTAIGGTPAWISGVGGAVARAVGFLPGLLTGAAGWPAGLPSWRLPAGCGAWGTGW